MNQSGLTLDTPARMHLLERSDMVKLGTIHPVYNSLARINVDTLRRLARQYPTTSDDVATTNTPTIARGSSYLSTTVGTIEARPARSAQLAIRDESVGHSLPLHLSTSLMNAHCDMQPYLAYAADHEMTIETIDM